MEMYITGLSFFGASHCDRVTGNNGENRTNSSTKYYLPCLRIIFRL